MCTQNLLSSLPKIDKILTHPAFDGFNKTLLKKVAQNIIQGLRNDILEQKILQPLDTEQVIEQIKTKYLELISPTIKPLINASGVVIQTNLGRSIFSQDMLAKIIPLLSEYNNLEYDLIEGKRGERYHHLKNIICTLFDCQDALVVNNNAAAVMLIINTFAKDKEVILSRGELVEIGGSFRIPEVIKQSGGILHEIGTTNKTHLRDYQDAINENTSMILKVHQSNFSQIGFVSSVEYQQIHQLAKQNNLIDYYDIGSGYISGVDCDEPSLLEIASLKPSLVSFSGDKLLGGPQAGIIFGKKELIEQLKKNHLLRALRIDKINLILLQETLLAYLLETYNTIPTLKMLNQSPQELLQRANNLKDYLQGLNIFNYEVIKTQSKAGGGSLPHLDFNSYGILLDHHKICAQELHKILREQGLISRIFKDKILLDVRCIKDEHFAWIKKILEALI
ncbi:MULTISPECIES: L-seryl-tRNA(Sec) selenium transferase [unclassified Helicobacter]|uniref:L-seryl-tRNA(Sec) selenium transferase n=1 Tax=unclassified Helicobacter TaxID=2593540 RepID=UPI000CF06D6C|nr:MULTISPECIES: L-seryl-tRNA(Sec) selenium transferase [unclassified Helicobacter]